MLSKSTPLLFFLGLVLLATSCRNPEKLANQGRYDESIDVCVRRLSHNRNKAKFVVILERAFNKANQRDVEYCDALSKQTNDIDRWQKITTINERIRYRQQLVEPLLPLYDNGRKAEFKFVHIEERLNESKNKAADELYAAAQSLLAKAGPNNRLAAREAYQRLLEIGNYFQHYKDTDQLINKARNLGTVQVSFRVRNNTQQIMPARFEKEMLAMNVTDLNKDWVHYDLNPVMKESDYDYQVVLTLTQLNITPESEKSRQFTERKDIQDGWIYTYDLSGHIAKDSLGREIKRPKMVSVSADVLENFQSKYARAQGVLEYFQGAGRRLKSLPISAEGAFENYASTFRGDERALSDQTKRNMGNRPRPFPPTEDMIMLCVDKLKGIVINEMTNNRQLTH